MISAPSGISIIGGKHRSQSFRQPIVLKDGSNNFLRDQNGNVLTTKKTQRVLPIT